MVEFARWGDREWDRFNGDRVEVPLVLLDMLINGATLFSEGRRVSRLPGARANWEATIKQARVILNAGINAIDRARLEEAQRSAAPAVEVWTCPECGHTTFGQVRIDQWRCLSCKRLWSTADVEAGGRLARSEAQRSAAPAEEDLEFPHGEFDNGQHWRQESETWDREVSESEIDWERWQHVSGGLHRRR